MTYPLLGQAFINAIVFGVQDNVNRRLPVSDESSLSTRVIANGFSGMIAGGVQTVIACPMELIKIRMQKQGEGQRHESWVMRKMKMNGKGKATSAPFMEHYQGPLEKTVEVYREQGLRKGLFRGWWVTLFREVPQFGIYFGTYTFLTAKMAEFHHTSEKRLGVAELSLAGGITGVITWLWYPMDVIKTRYQDDGAPGKRPKYKGAVDCCVQSYRTDGLKVFWRGFGPTAARGFLNSAVTLPIVTLILRFWRRKDNI